MGNAGAPGPESCHAYHPCDLPTRKKPTPARPTIFCDDHAAAAISFSYPVDRESIFVGCHQEADTKPTTCSRWRQQRRAASVGVACHSTAVRSCKLRRRTLKCRGMAARRASGNGTSPEIPCRHAGSVLHRPGQVDSRHSGGTKLPRGGLASGASDRAVSDFA